MSREHDLVGVVKWRASRRKLASRDALDTPVMLCAASRTPALLNEGVLERVSLRSLGWPKLAESAPTSADLGPRSGKIGPNFTPT